MKSYLDLFPDERDKLAAESRILLMTLPSIIETGDVFPLKSVVMNMSGMPDEGFTGRVTLSPSNPGLETPDHIDFKGQDHGRVVVRGLKATEPGVYFIEGEVEGSPSKAPCSNPIKVQDEAKTRLFWGDIHVHTVLGNCHPDYAKDPEFGYWYARDVSHLDFSSMTDHLRGLNAEKWSRLKQLAEDYNRPGDFVAFLGFESSHSKDHGGDINVYYLGGDADYFWLDREDMKGTTPKVGLDILWNWLDDNKAPYLTIPHHTGRASKYRDFDLPYHNQENEPVLEVFSMWGSSEARHDDFYLNGGKTDSRAYLQDALKLGYQYGVIGSSDTHHTMPGTPCSFLPCPYHHPANKMVNQGLAAVYASELTRKAIFNSLMQRNCYATTSTRPILSFSVNSTPMGKTLTCGSDQLRTRRIIFDLCTSLFPADVEIICNNHVIHTMRIKEVHTVLQFTDDRDPESLWIKDAPKNPKPFFYYYARVKYLGHYAGITAWSSPVWVQCT